MLQDLENECYKQLEERRYVKYTIFTAIYSNWDIYFRKYKQLNLFFRNVS